ncbi:ComEC/Rec2 family competence protein [Paracidobacterium acidisoli]|uniref:ComEC/Rec2 family competence protein n=1 Tax=Paracidobacterium acidisoli TaxID=2303751 RepID=UPI001C009980|nr:ComEC/Rec2 family competence protein [Paracidobacterium acidisoli]
MPAALQFAAAPALFAACWFAGGDLTAGWLWFVPGLVFAALVLSIAMAVWTAWRAPRMGTVALAAMFLLLGLFCAEMQPRPAEQTPLARLADNSPRLVRGRVIRYGPVRSVESSSPFSTKLRPEHSQQIDVRVSFVSGAGGDALPRPETARITLFAPAEAPFPQIHCGDGLSGTFALHTEERFLDPGVWDAGAWLRRQGVAALASANAAKASVVAAHRPATEELSCRLHALQEAASTRILQFASAPDTPSGRIAEHLPALLRLSQEDAVMLTAMLTGDRTFLAHRVRVGFERTGSFHLLVVSGMHLAIFSSLVFWMARRLRLQRVAATLATIGLSFGYAFFSGFGQPVERAFWMVALYLTGRLLWRERQPLNAIGFAALAMLAANPAALFDAGFQMTLLSVIAVAGIAVPMAERSFGPYLRATKDLWLLPLDPALPAKIAQFRVSLRMLAQGLQMFTGRRVARLCFPGMVRLALLCLEVLVTSAAIELMMALPMAVYFHRITIAALPVNLLIVPLLGLLLPSALITFFLLLAAPSLAAVPGAFTALLLHGVTGIVHFFGSSRAGDLRIPAPSGPAVVLAILLMALAIAAVRRHRFGIPAALVLLGASVAATVLPQPQQHRAGTLEVTAIDVGQGDSLLVVTPDGKTLLVDAGGLVGESPDANFDIGEDVVSPVLWSRGIRRLDAVAITHAHADHIGGMAAVLANFRPRELWIGINPRSAMYDRVMAEASLLRVTVRRHTAGEEFRFGEDTAVRVLAPAADYRPAASPGNNDSMVLQLRYGKTSALLEGDAEAPSEERMLAEGGLHSDVLKVGHHGSRTSTTPAFLAAVRPEWAAISVGRRNFYGHPRHVVLEELQQAQVKTFRTDMLGLTTFYLDGTRVTASLPSRQ